MKFMVMHKADARSEAEPPPTPELIANVGKLLARAIEQGRLVDGAGLRSSAHRVRVRLKGAERSLESGPYTGQNELIATCVQLQVDSMAEGIEWGTKLARAAGSSEVEIGLVTEPWDLGQVPKPEGKLPLKVLALVKSQPGVEGAGESAALTRVIEEASGVGAFLGMHALLPSKQGARLRGPAGARHVVDGPFAESKELVGGFMVMHFDAKDDAVAFAREYADVVGADEVDVREVH
jgi:hypothetical protein